MALEHTYYIPFHKKVYGTHKDNVDIVLHLVATYLRFLDEKKIEVGRYDGCSLLKTDNGYRVYLSLGCKGKGFGTSGYLIDGELIAPEPEKEYPFAPSYLGIFN